VDPAFLHVARSVLILPARLFFLDLKLLRPSIEEPAGFSRGNIRAPAHLLVRGDEICLPRFTPSSPSQTAVSASSFKAKKGSRFSSPRASVPVMFSNTKSESR
jgi:hypothetical protein